MTCLIAPLEISFNGLMKRYLPRKEVTRTTIAKESGLDVRRMTNIFVNYRISVRRMVKVLNSLKKHNRISSSQHRLLLQAMFIERIDKDLRGVLGELEKHKPYFSIFLPKVPSDIHEQHPDVFSDTHHAQTQYKAFIQSWIDLGCPDINNPKNAFLNFCQRQK